MKALTRPLLKAVLEMIRDDADKDVAWFEGSLGFKEGAFYVYLDGRVYLSSLGADLPFDWNDRRSIGRACRKRHRRMQDEIMRLGNRVYEERKRNGQ